jgi:hypothetical protein
LARIVEHRVNLETHPETERVIAEYSRAAWAKLRRDPLRQTVRIVRRQLREWNQRRGAGTVTSGTSAVRVPAMLQPPSLKYAGYAGPWFEEYYLRNYRDTSSEGATYVPILWDNFFAQAQSHSYWPWEFARRFRSIWRLLEELAREDKAYFTILGIYDFPIWNWHLFPENVVVFAANGYGDIAIPLLKGDRPFRSHSKDIKLSFLGRTSTHPLRARMREVFADDAAFYEGPDWEQMMARSALSLCPRGLGPASFRMYEALSLGSIPVYIWEKRQWLPYEDELDWSKIALVANAEEMIGLRQQIDSLESERVVRMQEAIAGIYEEFFSYRGVAGHISRKASAVGSREDAVAIAAVRKNFVY